MTAQPPELWPRAHVARVTVDRRGIRTVTVNCPWCHRAHTHGWPTTDPDVGLRHSHCRKNPGLVYRVTGEHLAWRKYQAGRW